MPKTFQAIAEENKDKGFVFTEKTMAQSAYTMVNSEGICAAFSMAYIKSQRKGRGKTGFHYFDDLLFMCIKTQKVQRKNHFRLPRNPLRQIRVKPDRQSFSALTINEGN